jgi:hypothetical protein
MPEIFIRGNTLKYIRIPEEVREPGTCRTTAAAVTADSSDSNGFAAAGSWVVSA